MENSAGSSGAGAGSECEGEDQDDSSSHSNTLDNALKNLTLEDTDQNNDPEEDELSEFRQQWRRELQTTPSPQREPSAVPEEDKNESTEDELSAFRLQWQRELESTPSPQRAVPKPEPAAEPEEPQTEEERAKQLFLRGVEYERGGKLYEAIQQYKRAMQILPDVETRLYESSKERAETPQESSEPASPGVAESQPSSDSDEEAVPGESLVSRFQRAVYRRGRLCEPDTPTRGAHFSWLPYEVVLVVLRWVVSAELDAVSLERVAGVCRGLYVAARDHDLWRAVCVRTWGIECGTPRALGLDSWRSMVALRPRPLLHGCYISKTTYLRPGENSFQDHHYRPWYLVDYYRYLRFFADGLVLMWTCAEEPAACVGQLRHRQPRPQLGIMAGHYRLQEDRVVIMIKKCSGEKKPAASTHTRFRARRPHATPEHHEQVFHLELEIRPGRSTRGHNRQLWWRRYAVSTRRDQWTTFDLSPGKFPPFAFSRVAHYTAEAHAPLPS